MKSYLDIENWARKEHFHFFKGFNEPFFGVTADIDCTVAYRMAKGKDVSFFLYYLHKSLVAINSIAEFRYRIEGNKVAIYDTINASPTIPRDNGTFGFSYMVYQQDFQEFYSAAREEMDRVRKENTLIASNNQDVVHFTAIPWIKFTSISHARHFEMSDSIPKMGFGKIEDQSGKLMMPVSVHVNHALMDGRHLGEFYELFQELMNQTS